jgi:Nitrous oxide-stimulated promoter
MVGLYCARHHGGRTLCPECAALAAYAAYRLDRCPFGAEKPACADCAVHCYRAVERERMREVMRDAGPRMLLRHPVLAVFHLLDGRRTLRSRRGVGPDPATHAPAGRRFDEVRPPAR